MKTPEEIKKGLEIEIAVHYHLPNPEPRLTPRELMCMNQLHGDALAYIQQLESRLAQVERERDAAVNELNEERSCLNCKHSEKRPNKQPCRSCDVAERHKYEWRGVCEGENLPEEAST